MTYGDYEIKWTDACSTTTTNDFYTTDSGYIRIDPEPQPYDMKVYIKGDLEVEGSLKVKNSMKGVEIMKLYDVYLVYGEKRKNPVVKRKQIIARNEEDARVKSGLMKEIDEDWDSDFLTIIAYEIGEVKIKEKPSEVKNV